MYVNTTTGRPINDQSIPSTLSVLPNVIEKSERTIILHGLEVGLIGAVALALTEHSSFQDFILVAEGTRIAIQYGTFPRDDLGKY